MTDLLDPLRAALEGRYAIERELGRGGMATVYLGTDLRHHRRVAIKLLSPELLRALGADRFAREIELAAALVHPHILPIFDSGTASLDPSGPAAPYYVMPYIEGESLRERLTREGQLPMDDALRITRQIGAALAHAHGHGVIHRDVKPENILLQGSDALLADFGVARPTDAESTARITSTGMVIGTPAYMSPEQAAGDAHLDARSDQYALATVLYEMLGGETPFSGRTPQAILARQLSGEVRSLVPIRRSVSAAMDGSIRRALAPAPADRFADIPAFLTTLEGISGPPRATAQRRFPRGVILAGLAVVAAATVLIILRPRPAPSDRRLGIAVMPFRATESAAHWSETLPDLLATLLDGTPGVRVSDPWSLWRPLRAASNSPPRSPDPEEAGRLARRAGASRYVLGALDAVGGQLNLTLKIYGVGIPQPIAMISLGAGSDSSAQLAQRAAVEVIRRVYPDRNQAGVPEVERYLTGSPEAMKSFLAAREAMRRGLPDSADAAITRAITADTSFALALLEAAGIRSWVQFLRGQPYFELRELLERARLHGDSMSERYRLHLDAALAQIETDGPRAAALLGRVLDADSTNVDAWNSLAYNHMAYGWEYGVRLPQIVDVCEHFLRLDSTNIPALFRRAQVSVALLDQRDAEAQLGRLRRADTAGSPLLRGALHGLDALLTTDQDFATRLPGLVREPVLIWASVFRRLRAYRPDRGLALVRAVRSSAGPGPAQDAAVRGEVFLLIAAGRIREADSLSASPAVAAVPGTREAALRSILGNALWGFEDSAVTARAVAELDRAYPVDSALAWQERRPMWIVAHLLGAWHASRGDTARARRWRDAAMTYPKSGSPREWGEAIAEAIESRLLARSGDTVAARSHLDRAYKLYTIHTENQGDDTPEPHFRYALAESLLGAGLADSAAAILGSFVPPTSWLGGHVSRVYLHLGAIAERKGDRRAAAQRYDQALQLLELGGPEVAGWRRRAEEGVRRNAAGQVFRFGTG